MEEKMFTQIGAFAAPRKMLSLLTALTLTLGPSVAPAYAAPKPATSTPIQHLVVIFQENVSFDHYFGTYPSATNPTGEPSFRAAPHTPTVNGLSPSLLMNNPN